MYDIRSRSRTPMLFGPIHMHSHSNIWFVIESGGKCVTVLFIFIVCGVVCTVFRYHTDDPNSHRLRSTPSVLLEIWLMWNGSLKIYILDIRGPFARVDVRCNWRYFFCMLGVCLRNMRVIDTRGLKNCTAHKFDIRVRKLTV